MNRKYAFVRLALCALAFFMLAGFAQAEETGVNVTMATISASSRVITPAETFALSVQYQYPETSDEPLNWVSTNTAVATVDATGLVTGVKTGKASIRLVGARSGKVLAKCAVTVRVVKISSFSISKKTLTIAPGREYVLKGTIKPATATYRTISWKSSDPTVVSVNGLSEATGERVTLRALQKGTARITATTETGRKLICKVTVKDLAVKKVSFPKTKRTVYLGDASVISLEATVTPATATNTAVTYSSSEPDVAAIDPDTGVLTLKSVGKTTVTATAGGKTGKCVVTVAQVPVKSVSIKTPDGADAVLDPGESIALSCEVSPAYASGREIVWQSENPAVAAVDENGRLTAVGGGYTRVIAASASNPAVSSAIAVHVRGSGVRQMSITAAGDAVLGGDPRTGVQNPKSNLEFQEAILKAGDDGALGDGTVFTRVSPFLTGANNITTLNLEGTLTKSTRFDKKKSFVFRGEPAYASSMLKAHGIDIVSLANNHTYDLGTGGYNDTKTSLKNAGVGFYGNGTTGTAATENGVKVGFLGYVSKGISAAKMRKDIEKAAKKYDVVVVAFHWTDVKEFRYAQPTSRQRSLARMAIRAGADLVLGHHTHRLNGIERYQGKYIVYDLGNFVTIARNKLNSLSADNPRGSHDYDSMIYRQTFNIWEDGYVEAADITIVPCAITSSPNARINNAQPMAYSASEDIERVKALIAEHSPSDYSTYPITFRGN